jgi:hypothetical protein
MNKPSPEFKREERYIVLKITDIKTALLSEEERTALDIISAKVTATRISHDKQPLECVVVESDWPEYEPVWNMIQARMEGKPYANQQEIVDLQARVERLRSALDTIISQSFEPVGSEVRKFIGQVLKETEASHE